MKKLFICVICILLCFASCAKEKEKENVAMENKGEKEIYLAGGCFWGMQGYFKKISGVIDTKVGYANGKVEKTTYKDLSHTDHAETLKIVYNENLLSLTEILVRFFSIIDPTSLNKQGGDEGRQYRTGIYYTNEEQKKQIERVLSFMQKKIDKPIVVEVLPLRHFLLAEEYHQDYLDKNPHGYCHINLSLANKALDSILKLNPLKKEDLKNILSPLQYRVTQEKDTEAPFSSEYDKFNERGIYVDVVTGKPLFASQDKYDAGCGWPSFTRPITTDALEYKKDLSHGMERVEVETRNDGTHLGHVFEDGIKEKGGLRYCINGASLRFIPYEKMEEEGYGEYMIYIE